MSRQSEDRTDENSPRDPSLSKGILVVLAALGIFQSLIQAVDPYL
jgi:hypothetical protein